MIINRIPLIANMMHKATLTLSLLFLAVAGSAQSDGAAASSTQPPLNLSSVTSQAFPSGTPISGSPTASDGNFSQTRPSGCHPHSSIPTSQPLSSGVFSSVENGASPVSTPNFTCQPDHESTIPTGTASITSFSGGAFPTPNVSGTVGPNGTNSGNFTQVPTASPDPSASGPDEQAPPTSTPTTTSFGKFDCLLTNYFILIGHCLLYSRQEKACPSLASLNYRALLVGKSRQ
jgi:hypothetical protein